jgi:hypothetical protein
VENMMWATELYPDLPFELSVFIAKISALLKKKKEAVSKG